MYCRLKERHLLTSSVFRAGLPGRVLKGFAFGIVLAGLASGTQAFADPNDSNKSAPPPLTVPKARCGAHDHPEIALQGQVPASLRATGFQGFSCNLELLSQVKGDGANWQTDQFRENHGNEGKGKGDGKPGGRVCGYHGTAFTTAGRTHTGVPAFDMTDPRAPKPTAYLTTIAMLDPWESLKVNQRRSLLGATNGHNGGNSNTDGGPEVDIYDLSQDCRYPQLLASTAVGTGTDGGVTAPTTPHGHEGSFAPDGLTYYRGNRGAINPYLYEAIDIADPTRPKEIAIFDLRAALNPPSTLTIKTHGLAISDDGNRMYASVAYAPSVYDPATPALNGFVILDTSEVQARKRNPQIKLISYYTYKDGGQTQHQIAIKVKGKPYVVEVDELGSGGNSQQGWASACANGIPPFAMARIVDISNEKQPSLASRLLLEMNNPANCSQVLPDLVGLASFTYGSHYCSVDNRDNATTLACAMFNSGIRVFDIRDPARPKEIAYYNPAGTTTPSPGSNHVSNLQWRAGGPDWCSAQLHLNADNGTVWTTCHDNGLLMLKFTNGVWPFPESSTPPGRQN
jgi:hypothetical protein